MKTTALGILTIVSTIIGAAISILNGGDVDVQAVSTGILAGWGLIKAADSAH